MSRRAEADRNDEAVFLAAREVFAELGADAPMSAIAARAGVGMGSLYRRYPSKVDLMRAICTTSMERSMAEADAALAEEPDGWSALTRYMRRCVDLRVGSLARLAGTFPATEEMFALAERGHKVIDEIVGRARAEGTLRADVTSADIVLTISEMSVLPGGPYRHRWLALVLDGLRAPGAGALPGPAPDWSSVRERWVYQESPVSRS
ncbi:TetR/AcrR family transcriptional regulator [Phytohabitans houttuyneae]|uniref:TetR family transcriptional regulator n=1 Tax=Phytohabitans houttuyneae TaxID=1076126 RepID=A0A6V8K9V0_9ACTN|nr:TetR/AcrR family transcriptional regulator [Phytohabitans houttuyneae]GFJ78736.1 TetR family transcriptional regulator [Phytohabitans houttuyneae]